MMKGYLDRIGGSCYTHFNAPIDEGRYRYGLRRFIGGKGNRMSEDWDQFQDRMLREAKATDRDTSYRIDRVMGTVANRYVERGEGTGGASKVLSGLAFPILTVLAVELIKDHQYIPLAIMAALSWTKYGSLVVLAGFVYFAVTQQWVGTAILGAYSIVAILSAQLGKKNVKRLLLAKKPMISPFVDMPDMLLILVFQCGFLAAALSTQGWISVVLWMLFALSIFYQLLRYLYRLRPRWNQIHEPLMHRYAAIAGFEAGRARRDNREFDFFAATHTLVKSVYPDKEDEEVEALVQQAAEKMECFSDRDLLTKTIRRRNPKVKEDVVEDLLAKVENHLRTEDGRKIISRYAIADAVESVFGEEERGKYLLAVIDGTAK